MKIRTDPAFILILLLGVTGFAHAQLPRAQQQAIVLKRMIERNHYSPRPVDDSLSSETFLKFIDELDPRRQFFIADDYKKLSTFRYKLDDELNGKGWEFLDLATGLYQERLKKADTIINLVLQKPFDFSADESVVFSNDKQFSFASTTAELTGRWNKWFKFLALNALYDIRENDSIADQPVKALLARHEVNLRQKIKTVHLRESQAILQNPGGFADYVKGIYFNSIAKSFDPHTAFFSPQEQENFQSAISTEEYSFGFEIGEDDRGNVIIDQVIPGGPAWKSGELNKNDLLLQLQWEGRQPADITMMTIEEAEEILHQYNHGNITVKIKKGNGTTRTMTLRKEKVEMEDDVVKGYVLQGEKRIGYISLPDFYTNWEDETGSGCANDVAKEIIKLKKENIEGLILDVRYNGGGSMWESLQMAGIFIDEGPLLGQKEKTGKLVFLKDPNRGTIYDGPMVLMVNGQSASASESLAAALQDYNRAVIVGSATYGKATMQQVFALDTMYSKPTTPSASGYVKITLGKLYRVNGQTAQLNGVIPDVLLPDAFDGLEYREKFSPDVLPVDSVKKNAYYKPLAALPVKELSSLSDQRISNNQYFTGIKKAIQLQAAMMKSEQTISLKSEAFEKWKKEIENAEKIMDEKEKPATKIFTARTHQQDKLMMVSNEYSRSIDQMMLKQLQHDIYIEQAYLVITDLIRLQKK
jgi:carboxyl-terminal processing protease